MLNTNIKLLAHLATIVSTDKAIDSFIQREPLTLNSKALFARQENLFEVWYKEDGFNKKGEPISIGFICLPSCLALNEKINNYYRLTSLSTNTTEALTKDYGVSISLPNCSEEHQNRIVRALYFI